MTIRHIKSRNNPDFCYACGKELPDKMYTLNIDNGAVDYELCRSCLKKLRDQADKALQKVV